MGDEAVKTDMAVPVRLAAVFLPAPVPRQGRVAFWDPDGGPLPIDGAWSGSPAENTSSAEPTELTVVRPHGSGVRRGTVPALTLPIAEALPLLAGARHDRAAHPATTCWGAAALHALRLVARGRMLPGLTSEGHDAARGPTGPGRHRHLRAVAAALPYEGHAVPLPGKGPSGCPTRKR